MSRRLDACDDDNESAPCPTGRFSFWGLEGSGLSVARRVAMDCRRRALERSRKRRRASLQRRFSCFPAFLRDCRLRDWPFLKPTARATNDCGVARRDYSGSFTAPIVSRIEHRILLPNEFALFCTALQNRISREKNGADSLRRFASPCVKKSSDRRKRP